METEKVFEKETGKSSFAIQFGTATLIETS